MSSDNLREFVLLHVALENKMVEMTQDWGKIDTKNETVSGA